jgi:hypothetical protein
MVALYEYESKGVGDLSIDVFNKTVNGYMVGKKWLNVTVSMWKEDFDKKGLVGCFFREVTLVELRRDYPEWWINSIFKKENTCIK